MKKPVIGPLEERRRDALVDFYRGHVANPALGLTTVADIEHYLLMDTQMTDKVETSPLAEAIACLQRYLGRIYNRMEPGHNKKFSEDDLEYWYKRLSNISDWSGYMMLQNEPQNYISPGLRLNKTRSFIELENSLYQASISDESVRRALYDHLGRFEKVCNLQIVSAYIDSTDQPQVGDGPGFKNTHYYFIGRQTEQPFAYYWRKVRVRINESNKNTDYLNPDDWTEWEEMQLPHGLEVLAIRLVMFGGRLSVVLVEGEQAQDEKDRDGVVTRPGAWTVEAKVSSLGLNDIWSVPISLRKEQFAVLNKQEMRLVAVPVVSSNKDIDDWLAVSFTSLSAAAGAQASRDDTAPGWLFACVDAYFQPQPIRVATLQNWANGRFKDQRLLQHKVTREEYSAFTRVLMAPAANGTTEGDLSGTLGINVEFSSGPDAQNVIQNRLQVQGLCQAKRNDFDLKEIVLLSRHQFGGALAYFEISHAGPRSILLTCHLGTEQTKVELLFSDMSGDSQVLGEIASSEFVDHGDGWSRATKVIPLSQAQLEQLALKRPDEVSSGGGMSIRTPFGAARFNESVNKLTVDVRPQNLTFGLKLFDGTTEVKSQNFTFDLVNWYASGWLDFTWTGNPAGKTLSVRWGDDIGARGRDRYNVTINQATAAGAVPLINTQASGAVFLDLDALGLPKLRWVRLNSPFGQILKSKVAASIDELFSWETQHSPEPAPVDSQGSYASVPMDFKGAHGRFYWELFFHVPFLIAHRLCEERNFLASQRWFHYLFDPRNKRDEASTDLDMHWLCRPLLEPGYAGAEANNLVDPDAMARACPVIYRQTIFMAYVRCILAEADNYYRRLTRDSLVAAKLLYERAHALLGPRPEAAPMSHWVPKTVTEILAPSTSRGPSKLELFAQNIEVDVASLPERVVGTPQLAGLELDEFRPPVNEVLQSLWLHIEQCLDNMANNLTIDGKPMYLALFAPPTNALDLLRAQAGGSSGASRSAGGWLSVPPYRFRQMLASTQNAVQTLMRFGQQVLQFKEQQDRGQLEELVQSHQMELSAMATQIQEATIDQLKVAKEGLEKSKAVVQAREVYYRELQNDGLIGTEVSADVLGGVGRVLGAAAMIPQAASGFASILNRVGGMLGAVGPFPVIAPTTQTGDFGAPLASGASVLATAGTGAYALSEALRIAAFHTRRQQEWQFQEKQASAEITVLDTQIKAQDHAIRAAEASLRQAKKSVEQATAVYAFHKTRTTNVELYRWLASQASSIYYQLHDAVTGLALSTQAAYQYETGQYDTSFIRTNMWMENYNGLMAAEFMTLDLARMESAYLHRNERRLEITRHFSLRQLFDARNAENDAEENWETTLKNFGDKGVLDFEFRQRDFDSDHPGHYLRQLTTVDVTFPAVLGAYEDTKAMLTQLSSMTAVKPVVDSLNYLYAPDAARTPPDIKLNLRNSQQIAVSTGIEDFGLHTMPDERYLSFEGTGAVSQYRLELPKGQNHTQKQLTESLTDIIVRVRYLALPGNTAYTQAVIEKLKESRAKTPLLASHDHTLSSVSH